MGEIVKNKKGFILHKDSLIILDEMSDEQAGKFIKIIYQYQMTGTVPELDFAMKMAIMPFVNQFIRDEESYKKVCEVNKNNGSKGGKQKVANATERYRLQTNLADTDKDTDKDKDKDNEDKKTKAKKTKAKKAQAKMLADKKKNLAERSKTNFEVFWEAYNYKKAKGKAIEAFAKALSIDSADKIIAGAKQYAKYRDIDPKYWKHPATWLNQQCWNDEYKQADTTSSEPKMTEEERKNWKFNRARVALAVKLGINPDRLTKKQIQPIIDHLDMVGDKVKCNQFLEVGKKVIEQSKPTGNQNKINLLISKIGKK